MEPLTFNIAVLKIMSEKRVAENIHVWNNLGKYVQYTIQSACRWKMFMSGKSKGTQGQRIASITEKKLPLEGENRTGMTKGGM